MKIRSLPNGLTWVNAKNYRNVDVAWLKSNYSLSNKLLDYLEEKSTRVDFIRDKKADQLLISFNVVESARYRGDKIVEPIYLILTKDTIVTFTQGRSNYANKVLDSVLYDLSDKSKRTLATIEVALKLLYRLSDLFFDRIARLENNRENIQLSIGKDNDKKAIEKLMYTRLDLVSYMTALTANETMVEAFVSEYDHILNDHQMEMLQDVETLSVQAIKLTKTASDACDVVSHSLTNILSEGENRILKFLSLINMFTSMPMMVFSALGQNVLIPANMSLGDTLVVSAFLTLVFALSLYTYIKLGKRK